MLKTLMGLGLFSWFLTCLTLSCDTREALPGVQTEPRILGPLEKGCQEGPHWQEGWSTGMRLDCLSVHPKAPSIVPALRANMVLSSSCPAAVDTELNGGCMGVKSKCPGDV